MEIQGLKNIKEGQNRGILCKINKETKADKLRLGFLGTSVCAHTQAYVRSPVICTHILQAYVCMQKACTCRHTLKPQPRNKNVENKPETKTKEITTSHALKQGNYVNLN